MDYKDEIIDHYKNPRNFGEMEEADVTINESNSSCGDVVQVQIKIQKSLNLLTFKNLIKMKHKIIIIFLLVSCNLQFTTKCFSQNWEWSAVIQSSDYFQPVAFSIDKNKNSYIGSHFRNMIVPVNLPSNGYDDAFLAKYDASGTLVWIKNFGSYNPYPTFPQNPTAYSEAVNVLHVDTTNNYLYASGSFYNTTQFGSFTLTSFTPNTNSYFILKMDFDGNILWAKRTNGYISGMVTDAIGNLFFCGFSYDDTVILDSTATFAPCGFVAKINPDGNFLWGKNIFKKTTLQIVTPSLTIIEKGFSNPRSLLHIKI